MTCIACGVPHRARVVRVRGWWFDEAQNLWFNAIFRNEELLGVPSNAIAWEQGRMVDIVVSSSSGQPLCQWCRVNATAIALSNRGLLIQEVAAAPR